MESLYTKYRPQTFADVVGQRHVISTLERAVTEGKTSHAYLFCGPRGTGKTTMARILAKALLCEKGPGQLPDGTCEDCRLIAVGEHPDVYELDAASRTGVDSVRDEIINNVSYAPVRGRRKVYIIDEVHMLTKQAFNALLKTLEEPPEHVVFIMCTTDPQQILATVLSRVQRFDFHSISNDDIRGRLRQVCEAEGFSYDDEALDIVVRHARGGMRDALSTLEQLSVFGDGSISTEVARDMLGSLSSAQLSRVCQALAGRDVPTLFSVVGELVDSGRDLLQFTRELATRVRDCYVLSVSGGNAEVLGQAVTGADEIRAEAEAFGSADRLARVLDVLGEAGNRMRTATNQRLELEVAFTRLARPESDLTLEALADRLAILEARVAGLGSAPVAATPTPAPAPVAAPAPAVTPEPTPAPVVASQPDAAPVARAAVPVAEAQPAPAPQAASTPAPAPAEKTAAPAAPVAAPAAQAAPKPTSASAQAAAPAATPAVAPAEVSSRWERVIDLLKQKTSSRAALVLNTRAVSDTGDVLTVSVPNSFTVRMLGRADVREDITTAVLSVFGPRELSFELACSTPARATAPAAVARPAAVPRPAPQPVPTAVPVAAPTPVPAEKSAAPVAQAPRPAVPAPQATPVIPDPEPQAVPDDYVPYDDADVIPFDEDPALATPAPQAPASPTATSTPAPTPQPDPAPAPASQPFSAAPATVPAAAVPEPSDEADAGARFFSAGEALPDEVPADLMDMLAEAFPSGQARVSVLAAPDADSGTDEVADDADAGYDDQATTGDDGFVADPEDDDSEG
ncbi:MAG: DNA polymerase III subunit gamma/tau [Atopobiaceae bacterium]|nr:DNA polymerase III subunit gamma/tau [Atopobiaceae bacterium]